MCGNYSREETIQGWKLYEEIRYLLFLNSDQLPAAKKDMLKRASQQTFDPTYFVMAVIKNLEEKDGQRLLLRYVSLIRACNKVL